MKARHIQNNENLSGTEANIQRSHHFKKKIESNSGEEMDFDEELIQDDDEVLENCQCS